MLSISATARDQDYNSFGPRSAAKAVRAMELARSVVSIELLTAAEAIEHHRPLKSGPEVEAAHARIRGVVKRLDADRPPSPDIASIDSLVAGGLL